MDQIFVRSFDAMLELRHFTSIILACICGLLIGYERKARNKQAGVKTHVIVCLTSALMMIISKEAFLDTHDFDSTRVAAKSLVVFLSSVGELSSCVTRKLVD